MALSRTRAEQFRSPQPFLGNIKPSRTYQTVQEQPIVFFDRPEQGAHELLEALWRSTERIHQISEMNRRLNDRFRNWPVSDVKNAVEHALNLSGNGYDAYFACAEYLSPRNRTADNVSGAYSFWMDIDCSEQKHAAGKGYKTVNDALAALKQFSCDTGLPQATHIVDSGGGLHAYWVMDQVVERAQWQAYATKLKSLTKACGLLADDSRTADIASVLRVPGTLNYKYEPPRPVVLRFASKEYVGQSFMLAAIDNAYDRFCGTDWIKVPSFQGHTQAAAAIGNVEEPKYRTLDIEKLASALKVLDPDCDDAEWKLKRIAPLAGAARTFPASAETLRELARSWSSGELGGWPSTKWKTPGNNGRTGEEVFDEVWARFLKSSYRGRPATVGTIYYDAAVAGWNNQFDSADRFEVIAQGDA